jgi:hypothetical protein
VSQRRSLLEVGIQFEGRRVGIGASRRRYCTCTTLPIILESKSTLAEPIVLSARFPAGRPRVVVEDLQEVLPSERLFHLPRVYNSHNWKRLFRDIHETFRTFRIFSLLYLPEKVSLCGFLNNSP